MYLKNIRIGIAGEEIARGILPSFLTSNDTSSFNKYCSNVGNDADFQIGNKVGIEIKTWPNSYLTPTKFEEEIVPRLERYSIKVAVLLYLDRNNRSGYSTKVKELAEERGIRLITCAMDTDWRDKLYRITSLLNRIYNRRVSNNKSTNGDDDNNTRLIIKKRGQKGIISYFYSLFIILMECIFKIKGPPDYQFDDLPPP